MVISKTDLKNIQFDWKYILPHGYLFMKKEDVMLGRILFSEDNQFNFFTNYFDEIPDELIDIGNPYVLFIEDVIISKTYRNKGYGKILMNEFVSEISEHSSCPIILLQAIHTDESQQHKDSDDLYSFYFKAGFKQIDYGNFMYKIIEENFNL